MNFISVVAQLLGESGFAALSWQQAVMILISFVLMYLAIKKQFEPLLLLPISFGIFLTNLPLTGMMEQGPQQMCSSRLRSPLTGSKTGACPEGQAAEVSTGASVTDGC